MNFFGLDVQAEEAFGGIQHHEVVFALQRESGEAEGILLLSGFVDGGNAFGVVIVEENGIDQEQGTAVVVEPGYAILGNAPWKGQSGVLVGVHIVDGELGRISGFGTEAETEGGIGVGDGGELDGFGFSGVEVDADEAVAHFAVEEGVAGTGEEASEERAAEEVTEVGDLGFVGDGGVGPVGNSLPDVAALHVDDAVHFVGDVAVERTAIGEKERTDGVAAGVK